MSDSVEMSELRNRVKRLIDNMHDLRAAHRELLAVCLKHLKGELPKGVSYGDPVQRIKRMQKHKAEKQQLIEHLTKLLEGE